MHESPNSFEAIRARLSSKTFQDIEGLDPSAFGFDREECQGPVPESLPDSMKMNKEHVVLASSMPFTQWSKLTDNVPHYSELHRCLREDAPKATLTVCEAAAGPLAEECVLRFRTNPETGRFEITQYSLTEPVRTPWMGKGVLQLDRTDEYFLLVCAHLSRDKRCGYCGAVLVDLLRQAVRRKMGEEGAKQVSVLPCAHIGGHIYACNVILYRKTGGVAFGLLKPTDVDTLVDAIASGTDDIPDSLQSRIRGQLHIKVPETEEETRKCAIM